MDRHLKWNTLPWSERVNAISINPDMANRDDIAKMASEHAELTAQLKAKDAEISKYQAGNVPISEIIADNENLANEIAAKDKEIKRLRTALDRLVSEANQDLHRLVSRAARIQGENALKLKGSE